MGPLWLWLLNSFIVGLMEVEIRFLVLFNTTVPLAPALVAGQWRAGLEAGRCRVTRWQEQWAECRVSTICLLHSLCCFGFFSPLQQIWLTNGCCGGRVSTYIHTHTCTHTHTHEHTQRKKATRKSVGVGGIVWGNKAVDHCLCRCDSRFHFKIFFLPSP